MLEQLCFQIKQKYFKRVDNASQSCANYFSVGEKLHIKVQTLKLCKKKKISLKIMPFFILLESSQRSLFTAIYILSQEYIQEMHSALPTT